MEGNLAIRYKVSLARETNSRGQPVSYDIALPLYLYLDDGEVYWRQLPDRTGKYDPRLPSHGSTMAIGADLILTASNSSTPAARLHHMGRSVLPELTYGQKGQATHLFKSLDIRKSHPQSGPVTPVMSGSWEVLSNEFSYSTLEGMQSGWHFVTSAASGAGFVVNQVGGSITLGDGFGESSKFALYGGGGSIDPGKWIKTAGKVITKIINLMSKAPKNKSGGVSTENMFSAGLVLKNPLWADGRGRMMVKDDFTGAAVFADLNVVIGGGGGIQLLFVGATGDGFFTAIVPNIGQQFGLTVGVSANLIAVSYAGNG